MALGAKLPGYGMWSDIKNRLPYYRSDFADALNYRVVASTTFLLFANILPELAFSLDQFVGTENSYGLNEVLMSSAIGGVTFGLFSGQPLNIVGVTGPISVVSNTIYKLVAPKGVPFFQFMCWVYLWSMVFHWIIAVFNLVSWMGIVTSYSCNSFGYFINFVYLTKAVEIMSDQFREVSVSSGFASVLVAVTMVFFGVGSHLFGRHTKFLRPWMRKVLLDYGQPATVVFFTGFIHFGGYLKNVEFARLPTTKAYTPTDLADRPHGWFIHFWKDISVGNVFLAVPFALLITFLFYFDHNVSAIMSQPRKYPLKKPASFHWDFALLGLTTGICGILGIPACNALVPQSPLHTESLVVYSNDGEAVEVVEQRVSNTVQGALTFVLMSGPFLVVLGLVPRAVLAGQFLVMGIIGIHESTVTEKMRYMLTEKSYRARNFPALHEGVKQLSNYKWFGLYVFLETLMGLVEYAITVTPAAIGFPLILLVSLILARWVWPLIFTAKDLEILDGPVVEDDIMSQLKLKKNDPDESDADIEMVTITEGPSKLRRRQ
ncbi:boron transporter 1 [Diutina catenulata]